MSFEKFFEDMLSDIADDVVKERNKDLVEELQAALQSQNAEDSANLINRLFEQNDLKDSEGNPIRVGDPKTIADQIEIVENHIEIPLTEDQRRFIAADVLYGLNAINLKYKE